VLHENNVDALSKVPERVSPSPRTEYRDRSNCQNVMGFECCALSRKWVKFNWNVIFVNQAVVFEGVYSIFDSVYEA
jgi:hypothetical protein